MPKNIKLRCLEISAKANKNNSNNILNDAVKMFEFTKDVHFDSFMERLVSISSPDTREEHEDESKLIKGIGRKVFDYINRESSRTTPEQKY
ncbi:hypothetical protein [Flavobacterium sp. LB1P71]|uniref:hypothetical protein n=1 Tax=Flavobacterium sp. LB1P71 TaxID=3401716 RepID=UPI003AAAE8B7